MASAPVLGGSKTVDLDDTAFGARFNGPLVHESVRAELNARRTGTAATKTRGNVRGGGAKPWRQKGTGRARQGSIRAPHFAGGGVVFGPSPRHYTFKVNRKERRAALRSVLSVHAERDTLAILDPRFDEPSTRAAAEPARRLVAGGQCSSCSPRSRRRSRCRSATCRGCPCCRRRRRRRRPRRRGARSLMTEDALCSSPRAPRASGSPAPTPDDGGEDA